MRLQSQPTVAFGAVYRQDPQRKDATYFYLDDTQYWVTNGPNDTDKADLLAARDWAIKATSTLAHHPTKTFIQEMEKKAYGSLLALYKKLAAKAE